MGKKDITPEEKLLKIIEKPEEQKKHAREFNRRKKADQLLRGALDVFKPSYWRQHGLQFNLQLANKILIILAVAATSLLAIDFFKDRANINSRFTDMLEASVEKQAAREQAELPECNIALTIRRTGEHNIFTLTQEAAKPQVRPDEKKLTALKLVGILWSENPQAMIEDTEENKTYMLYEGDTLERWKVKEIRQSEVILLDEAGEWELK